MLHSRSSSFRPLYSGSLSALALLAIGVGCGDDDFTPDGASDSDAQASSSGTTSGSSSGGASSSGGPSASSSGSTGSSGSTSSSGDSGASDAAIEPAQGPGDVELGGAGPFTVLAESAITNVPISAITGDVGISPMAATFMTGFSMTRAGTYWTSSQVNGKLYAADNDVPTPTLLTTAIENMHTAYTDAASRTADAALIDLGGGAIGSRTFAPGLYRWGTNVSIPTDITLAGGANDTWIFQVTGDLAMAAASKMVLTGGALPIHVVWQVAGIVNLGANAHAEGIVLGKTEIQLGAGASVHGRLLAQTAVTLSSSTVVDPPK